MDDLTWLDPDDQTWFDVEMRKAEARAGIIHKDGISWRDAPAPPKRHAHWTQTSGYIRDSIWRIERCPCGAIRHEGEPWLMLDEPRVAAEPMSTARRWWKLW